MRVLGVDPELVAIRKAAMRSESLVQSDSSSDWIDRQDESVEEICPAQNQWRLLYIHKQAANGQVPVLQTERQRSKPHPMRRRSDADEFGAGSVSQVMNSKSAKFRGAIEKSAPVSSKNSNVRSPVGARSVTGIRGSPTNPNGVSLHARGNSIGTDAIGSIYELNHHPRPVSSVRTDQIAYFINRCGACDNDRAAPRHKLTTEVPPSSAYCSSLID